MLILPEKLHVDSLSGVASVKPGLYDVVNLHNTDRGIVPLERVSKFGQAFLDLLSRSLPTVKANFDKYTTGGMYYRVIDLSKVDPNDRGGEFHYDTRRPGDDLRSEEGPVRIVAALTSDGVDISNIFTSNSSYHGRLAGEVIDEQVEDLIWAGNGGVVLFDEELDLHARPPAETHPEGTIAVFASAVLRMPDHELIECEAFKP